MRNFLCSHNLAKNFTYGKGMMITDLLFQLYSTQLQTLLLLEHREHPCHPPDKRKLQVEAKKCQTPNFQIHYFRKCNRNSVSNFPIFKKLFINIFYLKEIHTYVCIVQVCARTSPHFHSPSKKAGAVLTLSPGMKSPLL